MNSLVWKQWHESKRYLAIFVAWMFLGVLYCVGYELGHKYRATVGGFSAVALCYSIFAAVFLALRTSHGERITGTLSFSASLPVSMRQIGRVRIWGAAITLAIPIFVAATLLSCVLASGLVEQAEPRVVPYKEMPLRETASLWVSQEQLWSVAAIAAVSGIEMLIVLSLIGCWLRSQAQVGLLGAVVGFGSIIAAGLFWFGERNPNLQLVYGAVVPQSLAIQWSYGTEQGGYTDHELAQHHWLALGLSIPLLWALAHLFTTQYGTLRNAAQARATRRLRITLPAVLSYIPPRLPGRLAALIWLELRQSVPLALFGLLIALLMAGAEILTENVPGRPIGESLLKEMPHSAGVVAMLWAAVVGSSLYFAELGSGLGGFWRSRPISAGMWFWCKFIVGLFAVLGVLDGVTILISWNAPRDSFTNGMSWAYIACFPIMHAILYALAVLGTCWLRRPVIGGLLAVFGYAVVTLAITAFPMTNALEPTNVFNALLAAERAGQIDFTQHGYPLVYGVLAVAICLLGLVSSRLARPLQPTRWFVPTC